MIVPALTNIPHCGFVYNDSGIMPRACEHVSVYSVALDDDIEPILSCLMHFSSAVDRKIELSNSFFHPRQVRVTFVAETKIPANGQRNSWHISNENL